MNNQQDRVKGYYVETRVVLVTEEYQNKEDAHGGPGWYEQETTLATKRVPVLQSELKAVLSVNA